VVRVETNLFKVDDGSGRLDDLSFSRGEKTILRSYFPPVDRDSAGVTVIDLESKRDNVFLSQYDPQFCLTWSPANFIISKDAGNRLWEHFHACKSPNSVEKPPLHRSPMASRCQEYCLEQQVGWEFG
jgi:hypothetical protein